MPTPSVPAHNLKSDQLSRCRPTLSNAERSFRFLVYILSAASATTAALSLLKEILRKHSFSARASMTTRGFAGSTPIDSNILDRAGLVEPRMPA